MKKMKFNLENYEQFKKDARGDTNYCVLEGLCLVTNWNYWKCFKHCSKYGDRGYRIGTYDTERLIQKAFPDGYVTRQKTDCKTIRSWCNNMEFVKTGRYLIMVSEHISAWVNGVHYDLHYKDSLARIECVLQIEGYPLGNTVKGYKIPKHHLKGYTKPR
tara:strand:- start:738 stop:1214 length:477 start_codon:yes stop_codon:yes gene_type:complete